MKIYKIIEFGVNRTILDILYKRRQLILYDMYKIPVFAEIVDFDVEGGAKKKWNWFQKKSVAALMKR